MLEPALVEAVPHPLPGADRDGALHHHHGTALEAAELSTTVQTRSASPGTSRVPTAT